MCNFGLKFFDKNNSAASPWRPAGASNVPKIDVRIPIGREKKLFEKKL